MGGFLTGAISGYASTASKMGGEDDRRKKRPKSTSDAIKSGSASVNMMPDDPHRRMMSYKRGGKVRGKKGKPVVIKAHAGERVLTAKQTKKYDSQHKVGKRRGRRRASKRR